MWTCYEDVQCPGYDRLRSDVRGRIVPRPQVASRRPDYHGVYTGSVRYCYAPDLRRSGHYKLIGGVCLSVRPSVRMSVCPVPRPNSKTEMPGSPKLAGWKPITRAHQQWCAVRFSTSLRVILAQRKLNNNNNNNNIVICKARKVIGNTKSEALTDP